MPTEPEPEVILESVTFSAKEAVVFSMISSV